MVQIITDSTSDLSPELIARYHIHVLPLHILLGGKEYEDGVNISPDEIYSWADKNKTTPATSAPSLESAAALFRSILADGDEIIAFAISEDMSSSANVMRLAAEELGAKDRIRVINSENLSTGIGHLVIEAAIMASNGKPSSEIVKEIEALRPRVRASFIVDTLTYLHRGGRCSGLAAIAGGMLRLHPRIAVEDGKMFPGKKFRGNIKRATMEYVKDMEPALISAKSDRVFITHSGVEEDMVESVRTYLESLHVFSEILITRAGGVVSSHCGPGTLGVLFIAQEA